MVLFLDEFDKALDQSAKVKDLQDKFESMIDDKLSKHTSSIEERSRKSRLNMKVKIIKSHYVGDGDALEEAVNDFIQDKRVIDIKYQDSFDDYEEYGSALIMYEDLPGAEENDCYD